jgi:tRNA (guanine10-N2)-methyltransferase
MLAGLRSAAFWSSQLPARRRLNRNLNIYRAVYELWAFATNYPDLHKMNRGNEALWCPFSNDSFRFEVTSTGHTIPSNRKTAIINEFAYMDYQGLIDMKNARTVLALFEECE